MIAHTLIYRFSAETADEEIQGFFDGLRGLAEGSGLVAAFDCKPHLPLPVDEQSAGMTATHIAQISCVDLPTLQKFSELPAVHEFIRKWRRTLRYEAAYANHEQLPSATAGDGDGRGMDHTEHTVTVQASADVVYDVLADVEGYAKLFPPTESVTMVEESGTHQIARLVVDVSGQRQAWVSRRDLDPQRRVIAYRQLENAPMVAYMGGEWRALPLGENQTQLVITHDFAARSTSAIPSLDQATELLRAAVERNSHADLAAVRQEAEQRGHTAGYPA
jgi:ribosome-associated toxin RatA of RatAB toxin-antitoxin module